MTVEGFDRTGHTAADRAESRRNDRNESRAGQRLAGGIEALVPAVGKSFKDRQGPL